MTERRKTSFALNWTRVFPLKSQGNVISSRRLDKYVIVRELSIFIPSWVKKFYKVLTRAWLWNPFVLFLCRRKRNNAGCWFCLRGGGGGMGWRGWCWSVGLLNLGGGRGGEGWDKSSMDTPESSLAFSCAFLEFSGRKRQYSREVSKFDYMYFTRS